MKHLLLGGALIASAASLLPTSATAHQDGRIGPHATDHAPIGVMADHRHKRGEWMLSYRFMSMDMDGNRDGTKSLTPEQIVTTVPNRFFGMPMQPPTLRIVPTQMTMNMHMAGVMYGLTDRVTLMGMTSVLDNEMDHITFAGGMGTNRRGAFTTGSSGFGDSTVGAIIGLDDGARNERQINLNLGLSVPTGSNTQTDDILTPMGGTPTVRLPYPMQLGTGTWDIKSGLTYRDRRNQIGWGAQANGRLPMGENAEGYKRGARLEGTAWLTYEPQYWLSLSGRIKAVGQGDITGLDAAIAGPVQTADPNNFGGETVEVLFGINLAGQSGALKGQRLAFEVGLPVYRNLNGPQLETDSTVTIGWQSAF